MVEEKKNNENATSDSSSIFLYDTRVSCYFVARGGGISILSDDTSPMIHTVQSFVNTWLSLGKHSDQRLWMSKNMIKSCSGVRHKVRGFTVWRCREIL